MVHVPEHTPGRLRTEGSLNGGWLLAVAAVACGGDKLDTGSVCASWDAPSVAGTVGAAQLDEASGLVAGVGDSSVLWTHNDDGDGVLFGLSRDGTVAGTLSLSGIDPVDWESIAATTARGLPELLVGDIGDNDAVRDSIALLVTAEPSDLDGEQSAGLVERITVTLPDGPVDAEAMVVDPATGRLLLFTRDAEWSVVYAVDWSDGGQTAAERVAELDLDAPPFESLGAIRAADVGADGSVVLRLSDGAVWFPGNGSVLDALNGTGCSIPTPDEADGEGVAFLGSDLYFLGEGSNPTLWQVARSQP